MLFWILLMLGVYFVQTLLPNIIRYVLRPDPHLHALLGPRDNPPEASIFSERAARAQRNTEEALLLFLPLALLTLDQTAALHGAQIFVLARIAYAPSYILGVPYLRSVVWTVGAYGLASMAMAVAT